MIELIVKVIKQNAVKVLTLLDWEEIFISTDNDCCKVRAESVETEREIVSNHEKSDTKAVLHSLHSLGRVRNIIVRSPSGDIDIIVIMVGLRKGANTLFSKHWQWK